jgi:ppGpp synthetase/RelA/SpoT-type nucleotidyltranferase
MADPPANQLVQEYTALRPTYEAFTGNIEHLIGTLLSASGIEFLRIETRTKSLNSFRDKIERPEKGLKYRMVEDITDLSGVRIIAYYLADVRAICNIIEQNFLVDTKNSVDKTMSLDPDRFGYLSVHFIVSYSKERQNLAENIAFKGLKVEVQVRTVLQHGWAVLDRRLRYNNEQDIPKEVRRKLFRVSALLEIADENFSEIDQTVSALRAGYEHAIKSGNLNQEINLDSLEVFMTQSPSVSKLVETARNSYNIMELLKEDFSNPSLLNSISNLVKAVYIANLTTARRTGENC